MCGHSRNFCSSKEARNVTNQDARSRSTVEKYVRAARTHACVRNYFSNNLRAVPFLDHQKLNSCDGRE